MKKRHTLIIQVCLNHKLLKKRCKNLIIETFIANSMFQTNCYLFGYEKTKEIVIIDPGGNPREIKKRTEKFKPIAIILTHSHQDHAGAVFEESSKEIR